MDIMMLEVGSETAPQALVSTPAEEGQAWVSPDLKHLAYSSNLEGGYEVYVQQFLGDSARCRVSRGGGIAPRFDSSGKKLFFVAGSSVLMAEADSTGGFCDSTPGIFVAGIDLLVVTGPAYPYDVMPDGESVLSFTPRDPPRLRVVLNLLED